MNYHKGPHIFSIVRVLIQARWVSRVAYMGGYIKRRIFGQDTSRKKMSIEKLKHKCEENIEM